ncbi:MAG: hypothetical protein JO033_19815 [Acidobacteriaceae bacterium]|nr:hypothetical protein [Acidobacteriaceae bacterium]
MAALARVVLGRAYAELGRSAEGIGLIRQGIAALLETGNRVAVTAFLTSLAEAEKCNGAVVEALEALEQALRASPDELAHRPEILRLRGELRLKEGDEKAAENDFREAISMAIGIQAKVWELRASMSLAHLLATQGRRDEARESLVNTYNWFTEGFDTADLKQAEQLLNELTK